MIGLIIAMSVLAVASTITSIILLFKVRELNSVVAMVTMMVLESPNTAHYIKNGDNVYDVKFPNSEGF